MQFIDFTQLIYRRRKRNEPFRFHLSLSFSLLVCIQCHFVYHFLIILFTIIAVFIAVLYKHTCDFQRLIWIRSSHFRWCSGFFSEYSVVFVRTTLISHYLKAVCTSEAIHKRDEARKKIILRYQGQYEQTKKKNKKEKQQRNSNI